MPKGIYEGKRGRNGSRKKNPAEDEIKKIMNNEIMRKTLPLIRAGLSVALGQHFVYRKVKTIGEKGKEYFENVLLTDPDEIAEALDTMEEGGEDAEGNYYFITTKEPDYKAIEMLLNRAYGKPKESLELNTKVDFVVSLRELSLKALKREEEISKTIETKIIDIEAPAQENSTDNVSRAQDE